MVTRKNQSGWMFLGGAICLFGIVLAWKFRESNRASAQSPTPRPATTTVKKTLLAQATDLKPVGNPDVTLPPLPAPAASTFRDDGKPTPPPIRTTGTVPGELPPLPADAIPPRETKEPPPLASLPDPLLGPTPPMPKTPQQLPPVLTPVRFEEGALPLPTPAPALPVPSVAPPALPPATPIIERVKEPIAPIAPAPMPPVVKKDITIPMPTTGTPLPPLSDVPTPAPVVSKPVPAARANIAIEATETTTIAATAIYRVRNDGETIRLIARRTLGSSDRWTEVSRLNPSLQTERGLTPGTLVKLPADATLMPEEMEVVKPLPMVRQKTTPTKAKLTPLTGTYLGQFDGQKMLTLPRVLREQLGEASVMVSPGSDVCLWLTTPAHLERLNERLEQMHVREADLRVFRRLYYAQAEKVTIDAEGRVSLPERLCQFAGIERELVLVGVDDHIEVWDAARWRKYAQEKSAAARADGE